MDEILPVGKLPHELLARLIGQGHVNDSRVLLGPGIGMDCAVLDFGSRLLVVKSDPITFATAEIGWYAVHVNANDIATTGAEARWMIITLLLPETSTTFPMVENIGRQIQEACLELGITVVGGHTEITYGIDRPIIAGTLLGEVDRDRLVTPAGASSGDRILLTKGVPIEATTILAREFPDRLQSNLTAEEIEQAQGFLHDPGISIVRDSRLARQAGRVTAMHDPTEGGLLTALWELAEASGRGLEVDISAVPIPELSARICDAFGLNPLAAIASGALLLAAVSEDVPAILQTMEAEGISCAEIGEVVEGPPIVFNKGRPDHLLARPARDEIARMFE